MKMPECDHDECGSTRCTHAKPSRKRFRAPKQKPGELRMYWGVAERGQGAPDICYIWGEGCDRSDPRVLHHYLSCKRPTPDSAQPLGFKFDPSLLEELERRGYDMTTFQLTVQKKPDIPLPDMIVDPSIIKADEPTKETL